MNENRPEAVASLGRVIETTAMAFANGSGLGFDMPDFPDNFKTAVRFRKKELAMPYKRDWLLTGRTGEAIGGGFVVMRRSRSTGRVRPSLHPFEYAEAEAARDQAAKLAEMFPEQIYDVFQRV